jgi:hypothetical protein
MTTENPVTRALDFTRLIGERTRQFTGREWVFAAVDKWLSDPQGPQVFLLTGGPGTGKTAIAARMVQMSRGEVPSGWRTLSRGFLAYYHFCQSGLDSTLSPLTFVQSLSQALANRYPVFRNALERQGSQQIVISPVVEVKGPVASGAQVTGAQIDEIRIEIRGGDARPMFDQAVRRPLGALGDSQSPTQIVILVDSLDEALSFNPDNNIAQLLRVVHDFPPQVRFLLTCRSNNPRVFDLVGGPSLDLIADAPVGVDEVRIYGIARLAAVPEPARSTLATSVAAKSRGNFLYAYHVLNELSARGGRDVDPEALDLPDELEGVYGRFLERELASSKTLWSEAYRPLLGAIAVARGEGLTRAQLVGITGLAEDRTDDVLAVCREYLVGGETAQRPYRIYHQSFRDFLLSDVRFNIYPAERHGAIAAYLLQSYGKGWGKCRDEYALRYTPVHLAEAARGSVGRLESLTRSLIEVTGNPRYQDRFEEELRDLPMLHEHLERAVAVATRSDRDDMLPWLARSGRNFTAFRERFLRGEAVISLAEQGAIEKAEARLPLFPDLEQDWQTAAALIIAWLACDRNRPAAKQLRERVAKTSRTTEPLPLLLARVDAALEGQAAHEFESQPSHGVAVGRELVRRISGQAFDRELLASRGMNLLAPLSHQSELIEARGYAASLDGPILVNIARECGPEGTALLDEYVEAHAGYNYVQYRNRSLWIVLHAVLRHHPDQSWVRERLKRILGAALSGGGAEFMEMSPLVAAAMLEAARRGDRRAVTEKFGKAAYDALQALSNRRGANDSWSLHKRRLATLMEVDGLALGNKPRAHRVWEDLRALEGQHVLEGFAGFQAPAELRVADALRACSLAEPNALDARLDRALRSAHHIQDYHFCARITARCNALQRWHGTALDGPALAETIERFARAPDDTEFAADHLIHEQYRFRDDNDPEQLSVWAARQADTIDLLAEVFQRPVVEFLRLNPDMRLLANIPPGTPVRIPDPGLAPLLAVHFAARTLAEASLEHERARLIRLLVPAASRNPTALDTVLGYLFIAASPEDVGVLEELARCTGPVALAEVATPASQIGPDAVIPA